MTDYIVICPHCKLPEYEGEMRYYQGHLLCRSCYKDLWERTCAKAYLGGDLDGPRPTIKDYLVQEGVILG